MEVTMDCAKATIESGAVASTPAKRIVFIGYNQSATILVAFFLCMQLAAGLGAVDLPCGIPTHFAAMCIQDTEVERSYRWGSPGDKALHVARCPGRLCSPLPRGYEETSRLPGSCQSWGRPIKGRGHSMSTTLWPYVRDTRGGCSTYQAKIAFGPLEVRPRCHQVNTVDLSRIVNWCCFGKDF